MGLLEALAHRGERAWAERAVLARRPDVDFQGGKPAPLTCSKMPALLNREQLRQLKSSRCQGVIVNPGHRLW